MGPARRENPAAALFQSKEKGMEGMKIHLEKASESYIVGVLLAVAGGFLDVYTYICRGGVFANAQTGNIVLLGISAADGNWEQIWSYICPILAFMAGILLTEAVPEKIPLQFRASLEADSNCPGIRCASCDCLCAVRAL